MNTLTIQQAAQQAIDVQDACNLSGVLHSLRDIVTGPIWHDMERQPARGTAFRNCHPIVLAFLDKLVSLTRCYDQDYKAGIQAMDACEAIAQAKDDAEVDRIYELWAYMLADVKRWDNQRFRDALAAQEAQGA